ncbi:MAG: hypothetical protein MJE66_24255 [Proteobacteria bacterium]|nr:hypothetical protein [Pseudomonadota bacterium]
MSGIGTGLWIWGGAALLYAVFSLWYNNWRGPLTEAEIEAFARNVEGVEGVLPEQRERLRAFLEADDGREFFMANLLRLHEGEIERPGSGERQTADRVLGVYTGHFMPALFRRAGHPAFFGQAAGGYVEHWGVEPDPGWSAVGVVRYRSRRDLLALATDPAFDPAHVYKIAALSHTLAFPVAPGTVFAGPRLWVGLSLALVAALGHLFVQARATA